MPAHAVLGVNDLALQVGEVDTIVVDDVEGAHTGGGEIHEGGRAQPTGADDQHARGEELGLALLAHLIEDQMARVALELAVGESHRPVPPVTSFG
jgi:hypothetical protein